jgi:hypothetical protein
MKRDSHYVDKNGKTHGMAGNRGEKVSIFPVGIKMKNLCRNKNGKKLFFSLCLIKSFSLLERQKVF